MCAIRAKLAGRGEQTLRFSAVFLLALGNALQNWRGLCTRTALYKIGAVCQVKTGCLETAHACMVMSGERDYVLTQTGVFMLHTIIVTCLPGDTPHM